MRIDVCGRVIIVSSNNQPVFPAGSPCRGSRQFVFNNSKTIRQTTKKKTSEGNSEDSLIARAPARSIKNVPSDLPNRPDWSGVFGIDKYRRLPIAMPELLQLSDRRRYRRDGENTDTGRSQGRRPAYPNKPQHSHYIALGKCSSFLVQVYIFIRYIANEFFFYSINI